MHSIPWELSGFRKGNEFKQCVDLYEFLLHMEELHRQDKVNIEHGDTGNLDSPHRLRRANSFAI